MGLEERFVATRRRQDEDKPCSLWVDVSSITRKSRCVPPRAECRTSLGRVPRSRQRMGSRRARHGADAGQERVSRGSWRRRRRRGRGRARRTPHCMACVAELSAERHAHQLRTRRRSSLLRAGLYRTPVGLRGKALGAYGTVSEVMLKRCKARLLQAIVRKGLTRAAFATMRYSGVVGAWEEDGMLAHVARPGNAGGCPPNMVSAPTWFPPA